VNASNRRRHQRNYHLAMSSNYNMALRPPAVAVKDGEARLLQRRETVEDLMARDV
jgi:diaminopimelate decarboxylase